MHRLDVPAIEKFKAHKWGGFTGRSDMLNYFTGRPLGRIRNGLANGANDLPHHRPIFGAQISGELLLDRNPNVIWDQPSAGGEKYAWLILGRLDHRLAAVVTPDFGEVFQEACRKRRPRTDWSSIRISGLTGCHIRPFTCLVDSRGIYSVSFC